MKMSLRIVYLVGLIATILSLFACGGGGAGLPALPDFIPGSVTEPDRDTAMNEIDAYVDTVKGSSNEAQLLVAKLKTIPVFAAAEVTPKGDVVGWFKDGQVYLISLTDEAPTGSFKSTPAVSAPASTAKPMNLTNSKKAYLVNSMEDSRFDLAPTVKPLLQAKGYEVIEMDGTVSDFKSITDAGLLSVHAHGNVFTDNKRVEHFYYSTSEAPTPSSRAAYKTELDNDTLIVGNIEVFDSNNHSSRIRRYGVSESFLFSHGLSFLPGAFWYSQACNSFNPSITKAALGASGAATYAG